MEMRLKRFLSLILAIVMVIGMLPANVVMAEENPDVPSSEVQVEASTEPATEPEEVTDPATEPEEVTAPATEPEEVTEPATEPEEVTDPVTELEKVTAPATEPEEVTEPAAEPEEVTEPATEPEETTEPAMEPEEKEPVEAEPIYTTVTEQIVPEVDLPDNGELFAYFAESKLYGYESSTFGTTARAGLTANEQVIYDALKAKIENVAVSGGSTVFVLPELSGLKYSWTNTELGLDSIEDNEHVSQAFSSQYNMTNIVAALLNDCPFDLYWYDKTVGTSMTYQIGRSGVNYGTGTVWTAATIKNLTFTFVVSADYQSGANQVTTNVAKVTTAKNTAAQVVAEHADKTDYEKLVAYKDYICNAVSYDHAAADNTGTPYGDPWQLISVFDGSDSTNVVCEGYAKAFQYLCDLSGLDCISVSGVMGGGTGAGDHMWNVVTLEGAKYLVDVTNSDVGSVGQNGGLFLAGAAYENGCYSFSFGSQMVYFACADLGLSVDSYTYVPPVTTYTVTVAPCENGTVTANPTSAAAGEEIQLTVTPAPNYVLDTLTVTWGDNQTVEVTDKKFKMPAGDVSVSATFKEGISGSCGENLIWTLDETGTLTISGTGAMVSDYSWDGGPWCYYSDQVINLVIEDGATSIGECAFYKLPALKSVKIPSSVTYLHSNAFAYCESLTDIVFMHNAEDEIYVEYNAFRTNADTTNYPATEKVSTTVYLPYYPRSINQTIYTYFNSTVTASRITSWDNYLTIPVTNISLSAEGDVTEKECGEPFVITANLTPIHPTGELVWTLSDPTMGTLAIGNDQAVFAGTKTGTVKVRCTSKDDETIYSEIQLTVTNPTGVLTGLDLYVQGYASDEIELDVPTQVLVSYIPENAAGRDVIWTVENLDGEATIDENGVVTPVKAGSILVTATSRNYPDIGISRIFKIVRYVDSITILLNGKKDVTQIGIGEAMAVSVEVSPSDASVAGKDILLEMGKLTGDAKWSENTIEGSANGTVRLTATAPDSQGHSVSVVLEVIGEEASYPVEGGNIYYNTETGVITRADNTVTEAAIPKQIGDTTIVGIGANAFVKRHYYLPWSNDFNIETNEALKYVKIPDTVTFIGKNAFHSCKALTYADLGKGITTIGQNAFYQTGLVTLTIPNNVTNIGDRAFFGLNSLNTLTIPGELDTSNWLSYNNTLNKVTITGKTVVSPGVNEWGDRRQMPGRNAKTVVISDSVTAIEEYAFVYCTAIETVTMGNNVASIGERAFDSCYALTSINLPDSLTHIGRNAFDSCRNLQLIDVSAVPDTITQQNFPLTDDLAVVPEILVSATNGKANLRWWIEYTAGDGWGDANVATYPDGHQQLYILKPGKVKLFYHDEYTGAQGSKIVTCELGLEIDGLRSNYLIPGEKVRLTAKRMPEGNSENVKWSLREEDKAYASLSASSGKDTDLTVKSVSKATQIQITATPDDPNETPETRTVWILPKTVSITVTNQDTGEVLGKTGTTAKTIKWDLQNGSLTLAATTTPQDASAEIYWTSSNYNVAEVDYEGVIVPKQPGTVTITAHSTDNSGKTASFKLQVYYVDTATKLTAKAEVPAAGLEVLDTAPIHVYGTDKQNPLSPEKLSYYIPDDQLEIAEIDEETGMLTALKPGTVTITASIKDDPLARTITVKVKVIPALTESVFLTTKGSENSQIVMLDPNGEVTADPEQAARYRVYLDKDKLLMVGSDSFTVTAFAADSNGNPMELSPDSLTWATTDKRIATVTTGSKGSATVKVNAKIDGACVITATSTDLAKVEGVLEIFVRDYTPRLESTSVTMNSYLVEGVEVGLKPAYGAQIDETVQVLEYVKSSKTYEPTDRFTAEYKEGILIIESAGVVNNGTYKLKLLVDCTTETGTRMTPELTLSVKVSNKLPSITLKQNGKFNLFYKYSTVPVTVTAKDAVISDAWIINNSTASFRTEFDEETSVMSVAFTPEYIEGTAGKLDAKADVLILLDGYRVGVQKAFTVSTTTVKPSLSLTPASSIINTALAGEHSTTFRVYNKTDDVYMDVKADGILASFADVSVEQEFVKLTLKEGVTIPGKGVSATVTVQDDNWTSSITLTHKVTVQKTLPTVKFSVTTLKLNRVFAQQTASTTVSLSQQNMAIDALTVEPADTKAATRTEAEKIGYDIRGTEIEFSLNEENLPKNGTYTFRVHATLKDGTELAAKTFKVTVGSTVPTVKLTTPTLKLNKALGKNYAIAQSAYTVSKGDGYELVGFNLPEDWSNQDIDVRYDAENGLVTAVLRHNDALTGKKGKHTIALTPVMRDVATEEVAPLPNTVKLTVQVEFKTPSVTVTAKGKLDVNLPDSEIVYTVKSFSNVPGSPVDVTLEGDYSDLFAADLDKETGKVVTLKMVEGKQYNPKTTYKVTLVFHISGQLVRKSVSFKVAQTALKLTAVPTLRLYQSQTQPMKAKLKVSAPAGAAIDQIELNSKTPYQFRRALGTDNMKVVHLPDGTVEVEFDFERPGYLTYGKSYTVYLDVFPVSTAETVKATQIKLTVKCYK